MSKKPETKIQNKITKYLKSLEDADYPIMYFRREAGGFNYEKGLPDIYFIWGGIHVEVEIKTPTGSQSTMQEKFESRCKKKNIPYLLVTSVDEVKNFIDENFINN